MKFLPQEIKIFLIILIFLIFSHSRPVTAQPINALALYCEGDYNNLREKVDLKLKNIIVRITNDEVVISGIPGLALLNEKYKTTNQNDNNILFKNPQKSNYQGSINRYSGSFNLIELDFENSRWYQSFNGTCRATQKIF